MESFSAETSLLVTDGFWTQQRLKLLKTYKI